MPIPLFNSIASWFLKKRIHQMDLFMKYPHEVQQELLYSLLQQAAETEVGKKYEFSSIKNYEDFCERLPVVQYEDISNDIKRSRQGEQNIFWPSPIKWFAKSSGTTNAKSKFIPVSTEALEDCHYKAGKDMLSLYYNNNEDSQLLSGRCLRLGGSSELYHNNTSYFGDLSAIIIDNLPFWAELSSTPSQRVSLMPEWETKMEAIIKESLYHKVTSLAGVPSWMMVLLQRVLAQEKKASVLEIWPQAEVYFHGGVSFAPYREQFQKIFPTSEFKFYETYNASEGFFAIQDRNYARDLLLMLDYGIFYEFIPQQNGTYTGTPLPLHQVEKGVNYAVVITTNAGLWRYQLGDTVRFTDLNPYRIQISGRVKHHINVFGEELVIENAEQALSAAARAFSVAIVDFTAGPIFMDGNKKGGHEWLIEFKKAPEDLAAFTAFFDAELQKRNSDYEAKRYKNMTLLPPKVHAVQPGLFYRWLASKNKLGGQHKVPRLSNARTFVEHLLEMNS